MAEELASIRNTGADRLRISALRLGAAMAVAAAASAAIALYPSDEPGHVLAAVAAIPALAALLCAVLLAITLVEYREAPSAIEYSAIILMVRYRSGHFLGLSWSETSSILPVAKRVGLGGSMLYDLKLSVLLKRDEVVRNLSLRTAHQLVAAYHENAKKLGPDEAQKFADDMFGIKRYAGSGS
jgi:hypothetical protein